MIDFYTWKTPNGRKIGIVLEELGLPYELKPVDLNKQEQFKPEYLKINPNNKIPAIVDHDGPMHRPISVFESGAILIYLAEKTGRFLPADPRHRIEAIQWLMFQVGGVGPMIGQANHFLNYAAEKLPYAIERYLNEGRRLYRVMDTHLEGRQFFANEYSIADMAIFPWINLNDRLHTDADDYPNLNRWYQAISNRPGVKRGMSII